MGEYSDEIGENASSNVERYSLNYLVPVVHVIKHLKA